MANVIRFTRVPITEGLVEDDKEERIRQAHELNNQLDELYTRLANSVESVAADATSSFSAGPFVLWGSVVPGDLASALLHRDLTGADLHDPKAHKDRHATGGADPFTSTDTIEALVKRVQDDAANNYLLGDGIGSGWSTNQFLKVSGSNIISQALGTGGTAEPYEEEVTFASGVGTLTHTPIDNTLILAIRYSATTPATSGYVILCKDGAVAEQYTRSGTTITLNTAPSQPAGAVYHAWYWYTP